MNATKPAQARVPTPTQAHPQPRATTGTGAAGAKLKTFGAFAAGGLASAVVTTALLHGWGALTSNGLNPFGDGGKSAYKDTDANTGTAPKAGLAVRPAPALGQGQGMGGQTRVVMVQGLWPAITPTPAASPSAAQASTVGVAVGFVPAVRPTGQAAQPVLARGEALAQAPAATAVATVATVATVASVAATKPAARTGSKPAAASAAAGKAGGAASGGGTAAGGNWVTALMPGEAKAAPSPYYYEYSKDKGGKPHAVTQQKATLPAAGGNNWVASLMGNQPVQRTAGRASPYQTTQTALGSAAGVGGDSLTGGGADPVWAKGDVDVGPKKDPHKSRISVCTEERGMVSGCVVSEEF
jgi:hypothetical protein